MPDVRRCHFTQAFRKLIGSETGILCTENGAPKLVNFVLKMERLNWYTLTENGAPKL